MTRSNLHANRPLHTPALLASLLGAAVAAACCQPAAAQAGSERAFSGSLATGALSTPTYEGSPNRRGLLAPSVSLRYRTQHMGSVELGQRGLVWQFLDDGPVTLGLLAGADPGRKAKDASAASFTPGDDRLAGMGDVRASALAGAVVGYGPVSLAYRKSLGRRGHRGTQVELGAEHPVPVTGRLTLSLGGSIAWADRRYMQAYFGVTPEQALASQFGAFTPEAGIQKVQLSLGSEYSLAPAWKLQTQLALARLEGDARLSPLVEDEPAGATGYVGVAYQF